MNIPLSVFTDASLAKGNDLPKHMVSAAKKQGYARAAIVDDNSMSAVVRFLDACKSNGIGGVVGVTLSVNTPIRDQLLWEENNRQVRSRIATELGVSIEHPCLSYASLKKMLFLLKPFKTSLESPTVLKLNAAIDTLQSEGVHFPIPEGTLVKGREHTVLQMVASQIHEGMQAGSLKSLLDLLQLCNFELSHGKLMFFCGSLVGYKNILSLASLRAKKKQKNIQSGSSESLALGLSDIVRFGEGVVVIDPMMGDSTLGACASDQKMFGEALKEVAPYIKALGIPYATDLSWLPMIAEWGVKCVPLPTASFANEDDYEAYCVKVAVHNDALMNDFRFKRPDRNGHIHGHDQLVSYYTELSERLPIDLLFWDEQLPNTDVSLGEVHLPNYEMPVREVIEHAFAHFSSVPKTFDGEDDANAAFNEWISESLPEGMPLSTYRQKRLNDFCLHKLTLEGLERRLVEQYGEDAESRRQEYMDRINHEYKVIEGMGFAGYFLIEYDFVSYARKVNVAVGPGRGSAAGSLIVYCMEITDVDPIDHGLQFERFLNPERVSMPDIDVDFEDRDPVLAYIREKYQQKGAEFPSSSQIANINRYQLKSALSAVRRAYGLSMGFDGALKLMVKQAEQALGISAPKSITWEELRGLDVIAKRLQKEPMLRRVFDMAQALTGKMSAYGVHAGGVVISPTVIPDFAAIACDDEGNFFSQLDKDDIEKAGLIKFDILGLRTLSIISECVRQIKQNHRIEINPRRIDFYDPSVYELICAQLLADVFQLESGGMRDLVGRLQPQSVGELAVLSALYRPGALDSGMVDEYTDVKHGKRPPTYDHPSLEVVTKDTLGCIVYQEQVMSIVRELAGYSLGQADLLRRAMGKKKIEEMAKQRAVYTAKAMAYWREHYLEIGRTQAKLDFPLDVSLLDLKAELELLGIASDIDKDGYVAEHTSVVHMMKTLLHLEDRDVQLLQSRLADYNYVVMLFKQHYHKPLLAAVEAEMPQAEASKRNEVATRLYYALSQYVRFNQVFNKVEKFAGYGFNKSHAIAYSVVTYMSAYFKRHYPAEFYSAALSFKDVAELHGTVLEATQKMGIRLQGPDINRSHAMFSVEDGHVVRYGLAKLKGMGQSATGIVQERETNGVFLGVYDFIQRMKGHRYTPNSRAFEALSVSGAFDKFIPPLISHDRAINGRQFVSWYREQLLANKQLMKSEKHSILHGLLGKLTRVEMACYLTALVSSKVMTQVPLCAGERTGDPAQSLLDTAQKTSVLSMLSGAIPAARRDGIWQRALELAYENTTLYPVVARLSNHVNGSMDALTPFDWLFLRALVVLHTVDGAADAWFEFFRKSLNHSVTDTLNQEREVAGFYMTSTPIKVLKIAERVEREPPSSIIDGCPVPVSKIDGSYDGQRVTTYGIVRNVTPKTVKNEKSSFFGEKMLFCDLEDGAETIRCRIFGTKQVDAIHNKVLQDGVIALIAGEVKMDDFGLGISITAIKRYAPVEDDKFHVVRRGK